MTAIPENPKQVAESALEYEAEGYKILEDARDAATDPLSKATFQFLADQEVKHIEAIKAFAASLDKAGEFNLDNLQDPLTAEDANKEIKGIFARFKAGFDEAAVRETRLDVYEVALDMERRGHDFYQAAAEQSQDEAARKLYEFLVQEEAKHFDLIQDTHDFLKQPDAFMAVEERWMQI